MVVMAVALVEGVRVRLRAAKGMEIPPVHLLNVENFVRFKSQSLDFARKIHPLFLRQVGMQLE